MSLESRQRRRFDERVMVITGAGQGIGRRVAECAAREGARLALIDRHEVVHDVASALAAQTEIMAIQADLEQWENASRAIGQVIEGFGRIDVLINNVGGAINFKPFTEFDDVQITAEIQRSLMPTLWCCRAVLPTMIERRSGVIVNVSSAATRGIHRIPYSAAKGGVNALTASLAFEVAEHGIRVVATSPGGTDAPPRRVSRGTPEATNDVERTWFQAHIDQTRSSCLMHRYGTLDEQVAPILFLASDEASYITGSVLPVAGGDQG